MSAVQADIINIGLRAHSGNDKAMNQWQPTADYLSHHIPEHTFVIHPYETLNELSDAAGRKEFHFVLTNPSSYVEMEMNYGAARILTLLNKRQNTPINRFGSVIFTRSNRADIQDIIDLKDKSLMAVSERAFGGWRVARYELEIFHDINPQTDLSALLFSGGIQEKVVFAVKNMKVDVGVVRTDMLERMAAAGEIDLNDFRILGERKTERFPFKHTTQLYPEWPLAKFPHISDELANKVAIKLLSIPPNDSAAIAGKYVGWTTPLNYQSVHDLLRTLKVGPYKGFGEVTIIEAIRQHFVAVLVFCLTVAFTLLALLIAFASLRKRRVAEQVSIRLGRIIEESLNEIYTFDEKSLKFVETNYGARTNLGYTSEELQEMTPVDIKPEFTLEMFENQIHPLRNGSQDIVVFETRHQRKDGSLYDVEVHLQLMRQEEQKLFVAIVQDVTERKQMEEQLRQSQKMEAVGHLTGGIAHDFNNILGIVEGNLELAQRALPRDSEVNKRIYNALAGVKRGADITRKLLSFSRKDSIAFTRTLLNENIKNMEDLIARSLTVSIKVETHLAKDLWPVTIDTGDFEDAIINLSLNARDAMPEGGTLIIETANKVLDVDYVKHNSGVKLGEYVMISVSDDGIGMSHETKDKVLQPFFTTKEPGKGTGLGLSMVYGFVKRSGGHIKIYSETGEGTNFRIFIPRATEEKNTEKVTLATSSDCPRGSETVLVVDDEEALLEIAVSYLEALGYNTLSATDGAQALKILTDGNDVDLLFSDVIMQGDLDGYELASAAHHANQKLKILLTSGFTRKREEYAKGENQYLAHCATNVLSKPYSQMELAQALRMALDENT